MRKFSYNPVLTAREYVRREPVVTGYSFLVLAAVAIPLTMATLKIWKVLLPAWDSTPWRLFREFLFEAVVVSVIDVVIWLVVGSIAWAWFTDRRGGH